jgi:non-homologous end joining protein Ku
MKKILLILTLTFTNLIYSQTNFKKIQTEKLNPEKVQLAKKFIQTFLNKCENKDYTEFSEFNIPSEFKKFLNLKFEEVCLSNEKKLGKINLQNLNSAYKDKSSLFGGGDSGCHSGRKCEDHSTGTVGCSYGTSSGS